MVTEEREEDFGNVCGLFARAEVATSHKNPVKIDVKEQQASYSDD